MNIFEITCMPHPAFVWENKCLGYMQSTNQKRQDIISTNSAIFISFLNFYSSKAWIIQGLHDSFHISPIQLRSPVMFTYWSCQQDRTGLMVLRSKTRVSCLAVWWYLLPQNERCQLIKAHVFSWEITGEHFQSLEYLVEKCGTFSNLVAQLSVPNS